MGHENEPHGRTTRRWLLGAGCVLGLAFVLTLAVFMRRDPVRLSLLYCTNSVTGLRTAMLCLSNDSPKIITFMSDGGSQPYYQLVQQLTLSTNPMILLYTNYNQDAFFHVGRAGLEPHSGVVFPVAIPDGASNTTIVVCYLPPDNIFRELVEETQILLGRRSARGTRTYNNLSLKPPVN